VVKGPWHKADCSPLSSAEVKNAWSCTFIPSYILVVWHLIKHLQNFSKIFYCHLEVKSGWLIKKANEMILSSSEVKFMNSTADYALLDHIQN
jgi:hypothetical protein